MDADFSRPVEIRLLLAVDCANEQRRAIIVAAAAAAFYFVHQIIGLTLIICFEVYSV